jgi:hypothetical protein
MGSDVEVKDAAPVMGEHQENYKTRVKSVKDATVEASN